MKYKVSQVAKITGLSVRTIHYYDQIGLLRPDYINELGYSFYTEESLEKLQQILFFKKLDFPLEKIKEIISSKD